ncbi:hypothetical protein ACLEPN_16830 [Myxococcus sp. 1LA]
MRERPYPHEVLLAAFGLVLSTALAFATGLTAAVTLKVLGGTVLFLGAVTLLARLDRVAHVFRARQLLAYVATFFFYASVKQTVPALGLVPRDAWLLSADAFLFGATPAAWLQRWSAFWVNEFFSASYLAFHVYLHLAMAWALVGARAKAERFFTDVFADAALPLRRGPARGGRVVHGVSRRLLSPPVTVGSRARARQSPACPAVLSHRAGRRFRVPRHRSANREARGKAGRSNCNPPKREPK